MLVPVKPLTPGFRLGEYTVIKCLGQGGFGTTYLCADQNLQRSCVAKEFTPRSFVTREANGALAVLNPKLQVSFNDALSTFLNEARHLAQFNHPNIARIHRFFQANQTAYFIMEYETGTSLRSLLKGEQSIFTEHEIEAIIEPLCSGIERLHMMQILHRDIKPDNILIRGDGSPVLIDFGAAMNFTSIQDAPVIATHGYAPPEQFNSSLPHGPWIDIYALAATVYEMLFGISPPPSLVRVHCDSMQTARNFGRGAYSDRLLGLVDKALAVDYRERPRDLKEFMSLLKVDNVDIITKVIWDISDKAIVHFCNFARASADVYIDEFVAFLIAFPLIDLAWRLGHGVPSRELTAKLLRSVRPGVLENCRQLIIGAGFSNERRPLTMNTVEGRLNEYAAFYFVDRQNAEWTYIHTRNQFAKNCLTENAEDRDGFSSLMEDVIDRARGRVKKGFRKAYRNVEWIQTEGGWSKRIRHHE